MIMKKNSVLYEVFILCYSKVTGEMFGHFCAAVCYKNSTCVVFTDCSQLCDRLVVLVVFDGNCDSFVGEWRKGRRSMSSQLLEYVLLLIKFLRFWFILFLLK